MPMESLGGNVVPGRPVAIYAGGRTHVFAIGTGGLMNHWSSPNGIDWTGPVVLPGPVNIEPSYPCAIASQNVHVFAIGHGPPFGSGGDLVHWVSPDGGATFGPPIPDSTWGIPGGANGLAATSPDGSRVDVYAVTSAGIIRYSRNAFSGVLAGAPVPNSTGLPRCVPAAVTSGGEVTDLFAVGPDGSALRWNTVNPVTLLWNRTVLPRPASAPPGPVVRSGFAAVSPAPGQVEGFAVTSGGQLTNWSLAGGGVTVSDLPSAPMPIADGVPAALIVDGHLEVFAIAAPPNAFTGAPLVRWRRDRDVWSEATVIGADLSAGGLAAAAGGNRVDVFGLRSDLQHWPAGIAGASREPWANWANNQQVRNPVAHCHPSTAEEIVAIVKTAEKVPGARVRAVGSSWSFPDIAVTPSVIVETNDVDSVITHVIDDAVLTEHAPNARYLIHVGGGIQVENLMTVLDARNLAPFTMGGSSGQTVAGVISTGVHGSDWDRGPIPNAVRAIHLVGPGGTEHWIEPDQWRITDEARLRQRLGPAVQIRYDDDWFDSVLVSVGSMGIIASVVLEVTDQYTLERNADVRTWSEVKAELMSGSLFVDPDHYVMLAFDPAEAGHQTCYVVRHRDTGLAKTPASGPPDPRAVFCQLEISQAFNLLETLGLLEAVILDPAINAVLAGFALPPLPPGVALKVAVGAIVLGLKAAGPGAVGDFLGTILNGHPEAVAAIATWLTRESLVKPVRRDDAHRVMAPADPGECAARGLGVELAFDTSTGGYLAFVEDAMALLDQRRTEGRVLGGWFSLRFVGSSRAILSPQQSARTCMVEFVGLRTLNSTAPLLDELELLGKRRGAIQHWGMFSVPNLARADVERAYPRLDTWRRVRQAITAGGTVQTFENAFSTRVGLDAPPAGTPLMRQMDWRWCNKCLGMAFGGGQPGPCAAGGTHDHSASGNYAFPHNAPWSPGQRNWRWCRKCAGMTFAGAAPGACPTGDVHDLGSSGEYTVLRNGQSNWRWCRKCESLAFGGASQPGPCPVGGTHDHSLSGDYWLPTQAMIVPSATTTTATAVGRRTRDRGLGGTGTGIGMATLSRAIEPTWNSVETPGQRGWRWCDRCQGLSRPGGTCVGGVAHSHDASGAYVVAMNAPTAPGQAHWRLCNQCQTLSFRPGVCFQGGAHQHFGSDDYTVLQNAGQSSWRYCTNCQGLWFSGNGGQGRCPAPAGVHDLGPDDYVIAAA